MSDAERLGRLLADAARGRPPRPDGSVEFLAQPSRRDAGVIAFTAHTVVFADVDPGDPRLRKELDPGDLAAPLKPPFLTALGAVTGRLVANIDLLTVAEPLPGPSPLPGLRETGDRAHPRIVRALEHRDDVRGWTVPGGTVVLGRGVAGRWEMAVEVDPEARGRGLGRQLALAVRHLVPDGEPLWAQVAPGNAASVRALLAAGFTPIAAEVLLTAE